MDKRFKSIKVFDGVYLYRDTKNSPFYQVRIRIPSDKKHKVKSTGTDDLMLAKEFAKSYYQKFYMLGEFTNAPEELTFRYWCKRYLKSQEETKHLNKSTIHVEYNRLLSPNVGMCSSFGNVDISKITNNDLSKFISKRNEDLLNLDKPLLSSNTKNKYVSLIRTVLRYALIENGLSRIPELLPYKKTSRDNPRPAFEFEGENSEYKRLLAGIRKSVIDVDTVRYQQITEDLYDVVMFIVHGFLRPTVSEVFAIKYKDIKIVDTKTTKTLQIRVNKGKTGFRISNSTEFLLDRFELIKQRNPDHNPDDYIFMKEYLNRKTVSNIFQKQFQFILEKYKLENDGYGQRRSLYSCRHLAIQMRLVKSGGKINILWFAKNCGTSVEMIERFYAKYLPNSSEVVKNLQSFADK